MSEQHDEVAEGKTALAVLARGITKRFPGVLANDRIDFEAAKGEVHALLGENGAGKSTLSNIITGLYRPDDGELFIQGKQVHFSSPHEAFEAGIGMVHQHFKLVPVFTVAENVILGGDAPMYLDRSRIAERVAQLSQRYHMAVDPRAKIWQLSVGEQQRVEILKALYRNVQILILDEPTSVLTPQEAEALFTTLRGMAAEGRTIVFISHKLDEVMAVSDRVTVLRDGRSVGTLRTSDTSPRELARMMVGRDIFLGRKTSGSRAREEVVLQVQDVSCEGDLGLPAVRSVSFALRAGEILGIAGVAGNGQRELAEVIAGIRKPTSGALTVAGYRLKGGDAREAIDHGVAYVPEDRLGTGIAGGLSGAENLILKGYRRPPASQWGILRLRTIEENARETIRRFDVRTPGPHAPVRSLSGGNIQKLLFAREFTSGPRVLVAQSPTRGLDVGATEAVRGLLLDAAAQGMGVLLISEDLDEVRALSDRIAVLYEGTLMDVLDAETAEVEDLGLMMAGAAR